MTSDTQRLGTFGSLATHVTNPSRPATAYSIKTPFGRVWLTRDHGDSTLLGRDVLVSKLMAHHDRPDGRRESFNLGSGLVTNAGVNLLANDFANTTATLKLMNQHQSGTGTTAAAASDIILQTPIATIVAGTQSLVAPNTYQSSATISYTATLAVTEWTLANNATAIVTGTATSSSATGLGFSALGTAPTVGDTVTTVNPATNTSTNTMGLITASSTTSITVPGWFTLANAAGSTPGSTTAFSVIPTILDHKVFAAINVVSGSSITFSYTIAVVSGG
jgi:hypothetical protein